MRSLRLSIPNQTPTGNLRAAGPIQADRSIATDTIARRELRREATVNILNLAKMVKTKRCKTETSENVPESNAIDCLQSSATTARDRDDGAMPLQPPDMLMRQQSHAKRRSPFQEAQRFQESGLTRFIRVTESIISWIWIAPQKLDRRILESTPIKIFLFIKNETFIRNLRQI